MASIGTGYMVKCEICGRRIKGARYARCKQCRESITTEVRTLPSGNTFRRNRCACGATWDTNNARGVRADEKPWHYKGCKLLQ